MKRNYNTLIVDDHQIIIDTYRNALKITEESTDAYAFNISQAKNCDEAYEIVKAYSNLEELDLLFLDIQLPPSSDKKILSGEHLGKKIKELYPKAKIIVCTNLNDNFRLNNIFKTINPDSFLVKSDIDFGDLIEAIKKVISNDVYYSRTLRSLLRKKATNDVVLDEIDIRILHEISNGARMKELLNVVPLTKTGIEKRKRNLKSSLQITNNSDRDLILKAKEIGFI
ncbi:response regulator [Psychroserpens sp. MEBiC05023]